MQGYACSLCLAEPGQHTAHINAVRFSPDETKLLTQSRDGTAKVWDAQTGALLLTVPVARLAGHLCCFSPCGELIVSSSADGKELTLLRASDGSTVAAAPDAFSGADVRSAAFSPDGMRLAVVSWTGGLRFFGVPELNLLSTLPREDDGWMGSVAFTGDGQSLLAATYSSVEVWDIAPGGQPKLRHKLRDYGACNIGVSPDGKHAVAGGANSAQTDVWELGSGARVLQLPTKGDGWIRDACWLPSGDVIATCSEAGVVRFWSVSSSDPGSSGQLLGSVDVFSGRPRGGIDILAFCLSPSGGVFACAGGDIGQELPFVKIFRTPTITPLQRQLGELLRSGRGADVTLACACSGSGSASSGVLETKAHSLILALRSGTLQRQLGWSAERRGGGAEAAAGGGAASGSSRLEIDSSVEPAILERLLEYMYTDHLVIQSAEEAQHLLQAAAFYDVPGLFQLCLPALERLLAAENVAETLIAADKFGAAAAGLKLAALRFVKDNGEAVAATPGWERLPARLLREFFLFERTGKLPVAPPAAQQQLEVGGAAAGGGAAAATTAGAEERGDRNVRQRTV